MDKEIVVLTGPTCSGKGFVSKMLQERKYAAFTFSDRIREYSKNNPNIGDREELQNMGDFMRKNFGNGILSALTLRLILKDDRSKFVIDGIRHPAEIHVLKNFFGDEKVKVIGINASQASRWEWMKARNKPGDPKTFQEFIKIDDRELYGGNGTRPYMMNINECLKLVDGPVVPNEMGIDKLIQNTEFVFRTLGIDPPKVVKEKEI